MALWSCTVHQIARVRIPLEDILNSFVGGTLMEDRSFVEAKEWRGD